MVWEEGYAWHVAFRMNEELRVVSPTEMWREYWHAYPTYFLPRPSFG